MKGRTSKGLLPVQTYLVGMELAGTIPEGLLKAKLLSERGCDITTQVEDERDTRFSLSPDEQAFYKSLPEWNEDHYDFDCSGSHRSQEHSKGDH